VEWRVKVRIVGKIFKVLLFEVESEERTGIAVVGRKC
jgi:hypothetical protein